MLRATGIPAILLLAGLLLSGCDRKDGRADLVFINGAEPESLDPAVITGQPEGRVVSALFEGLTRFDRHARAVPGTADSWTISPDGRTYTFHLRADAKWSDGAPVMAGDFVDSWRRVLTPATAAANNYQLFYLKNAKAFADGKLKDFAQVGVRAIDDRTLEVQLEYPTPFFLELCAGSPLLPVPMRLIERAGDDWIKPGRIVNNGAYLLNAWRINDRIRLRKNPFYWDRDHVALETVDVLPISKANVAFNFYASGEADLMLDKGLAPTALLDELKRRPDFHSAPFLATYFLRFNCNAGPFRDARVRRAFALAVDKQRLVQKITRGGERPAASLVPPGIAGYVPPEGVAYDPAGARRLLAEAGYPNGRGFPLVRYLYSESELNEALAVELQSMWRDALGVQVALTRQEWKVYLNSMNSLDYDICRSSWVGDYPDPNTFLDMFLTGGGNNRTGWGDAAYDALIASAASEADPKRRFATLAQAEDFLIAKEFVVCPLYFYVGIQLYDPRRVRGIEPNVLDEHPIRLMERK
ncbi:MAG: peptide ABC transporter substrate-binding protein [Terrimicrobiaceae bacterium]|nr:peptide ABC transporter substrate-binding protein [Terrimicrobiaceae bacterium]